MTTPNNSGPDYTRYSLERLQEARRNIDTERFPERTHLLDVLIADRQLRGEVIPPPPAEPSRHSLPEPKTPGQALLMMAASAMFISLIAVISYQPTTTHPQGKWFLILLGVIGAYQIAHFALCYVQLRKQQTATPTQSDAPASPGNSAQPARDRQAVRSAPVTKTKSPAGNTSPIERL